MIYNRTTHIQTGDDNVSSIQQALEECRDYAHRGESLARDSFSQMRSAIDEEKNNLRAAENRQQSDVHIENNQIFSRQLRATEFLEYETVRRADKNLDELKSRMSEFTIVLYGRTKAGKSTLMEIVTHGNGSSIGNGSQRTTQDVRKYRWQGRDGRPIEGLLIVDTPGTCSFDGEEDDELAFKEAKNADLVLFMLTSDAPQKSEADRLAELKRLGKPVLGLLNVKQNLSLDRNSEDREFDIEDIRDRLNDRSTLNTLVNQFKRLATDVSFEDIPFENAHLLSAFRSQVENDPRLYELSNFAAVENFILDKVQRDGKFMRIKTFVDAVARPMQQSISAFYAQNIETNNELSNYKRKFERLDDWQSEFHQRAQKRLKDFLTDLRSQFRNVISNFVDNHYDDVHAEDAWARRNREMNLSGQAQKFLNELSGEAIRKMRSLDADLVDELGRLPGVSMDVNSLPWTDLSDYRGGLGTAALAVAFVNPLAGLAMGIGSLFFSSKSKKIRQQKEKMSDALGEVRDKTIVNLENQLSDIINREIIGNQIGKFRNSLIAMYNSMVDLADGQEKLGTTINFHFRNLNFNLFVEAARYVNNPVGMKDVCIARIVGKDFIMFSTTAMSEDIRKKLSNVLGENVRTFRVNDKTYWHELQEIGWTRNFEKRLRQQILSSP